MYRLPLLLAAALLAFQAQAQPGGGPGGGSGFGPGGGGRNDRGDRAERAFDRQQLRGELRAARGARPVEAEPLPDSATPVRHLSPRERAEMREQLRRENPVQRTRGP